MQAEERVEVRCLRLGDDLAVVLGVVAVDHHAVEPGQRPDRLRGDVVQLLQRRRPVELADRAADGLIGVREGERARATGGLELDHQRRRRQPRVDVTARVVPSARDPVQQGVDGDRGPGDVEHDLDGVPLTQVAERAGRPGDGPRGPGTEQVGQRPAERLLPRVAEEVGQVLRHLPDDEVGIADLDEHTARLDAARDVDRLALAVAEIDGGPGRQELQRPIGLRHAGTWTSAVTGRHQPASAPNVARAAATIVAGSPPSATRLRAARRKPCHMAPVSAP